MVNYKIKICIVVLFLMTFLGCDSSSTLHPSEISDDFYSTIVDYKSKYDANQIVEWVEIDFYGRTMKVGVVGAASGVKYGFTSREGLDGRVWIVNSGKYEMHDFEDLLFVTLETRWVHEIERKKSRE